MRIEHAASGGTHDLKPVGREDPDPLQALWPRHADVDRRKPPGPEHAPELASDRGDRLVPEMVADGAAGIRQIDGSVRKQLARLVMKRIQHRLLAEAHVA